MGPDCQAASVEKSGLLEVLKEAFMRLNKIAGFKIKFHYIADTESAVGSTGLLPPGTILVDATADLFG